MLHYTYSFWGLSTQTPTGVLILEPNTGGICRIEAIIIVNKNLEFRPQTLSSSVTAPPTVFYIKAWTLAEYDEF